MQKSVRRRTPAGRGSLMRPAEFIERAEERGRRETAVHTRQKRHESVLRNIAQAAGRRRVALPRKEGAPARLSSRMVHAGYDKSARSIYHAPAKLLSLTEALKIACTEYMNRLKLTSPAREDRRSLH